MSKIIKPVLDRVVLIVQNAALPKNSEGKELSMPEGAELPFTRYFVESLGPGLKAKEAGFDEKDEVLLVPECIKMSHKDIPDRIIVGPQSICGVVVDVPPDGVN